MIDEQRPVGGGRYTAAKIQRMSSRTSGAFVKVVILAGGLGTRLSEETASRPKPMVEIGERPILWHIMKSYSHYGFSDFVVCLGYKGYVIKEYFSNYFLHMSDVTFDMRDNSMVVHQNAAEPWRVTLVDTGAETQTGGRIKRVSEYIGDDTFMLAYGDGVSNVDIAKLRRVPPCPRQAGDDHGRPADRPLRITRDRGRRGRRRGRGAGRASLPGKADR